MTSPVPPNLTSTRSRWQPGTWQDYERSRDRIVEGSGRVFYNAGFLWVDMGGEGMALEGLAIALIEQTLVQLAQDVSNSAATQWFATQLTAKS